MFRCDDELRQHRVHARGVVVVEQQPYAHSAVGGAAQGVEQQAPGDVVVPDVVLEIEAAFGRVGECGANGKGVQPSREGDDAGLAGVGLKERSDLPAQTRIRAALSGERCRRHLSSSPAMISCWISVVPS